MKSLFKNENSKLALIENFIKFRSFIPFQTSCFEVKTHFGRTNILNGGNKEGPPLILLHGMKTTSAHLLFETHLLLKHFNVYAIDIIGQSVMSEDRKMSLKNKDYSLWLNEVLESLNLNSVHLLGVSFGGFVATQFAANYPDKVQKLSLLVPAGLVNGPIIEGITKFGWPFLKFSMDPSEKNFDRFLKYLLTTKDDRWVHYMKLAFTGYNFDVSIPPLFSASALQGISAPTQVIAGEKDLSFPGQKMLDRSKKVFKNLQDSYLIQNSFHCPPTTPEFRTWLCDRITSFLQTHHTV